MNVCKPRVTCFVAFILLLVCICLPIHAAPAVILAESFESPVVSDTAAIDPPGWVRSIVWSTGIWNEDSGHFTTPYGDQVLAIYIGHTVTYTNSTDQLHPGVTYTLTFNAGNARHDTSVAGINTYKAEILAGTNVIAEVTGQTDTNDMFAQGTVSVETDGDHPHLGEILGVRFRHFAGEYYYRTLIDNVKLEAVESDEWKHTLFLGK